MGHPVVTIFFAKIELLRIYTMSTPEPRRSLSEYLKAGGEYGEHLKTMPGNAFQYVVDGTRENSLASFHKAMYLIGHYSDKVRPLIIALLKEFVTDVRKNFYNRLPSFVLLKKMYAKANYYLGHYCPVEADEYFRESVNMAYPLGMLGYAEFLITYKSPPMVEDARELISEFEKVKPATKAKYRDRLKVVKGHIERIEGHVERIKGNLTRASTNADAPAKRVKTLDNLSGPEFVHEIKKMSDLVKTFKEQQIQQIRDAMEREARLQNKSLTLSLKIDRFEEIPPEKLRSAIIDIQKGLSSWKLAVSFDAPPDAGTVQWTVTW
jgi:hypothetical protein